MTAHDTKANVIVIIGAKINITLFELAGIIISLKYILKHQLMIEVTQMGQQHLVLVFFEQKPKLFYLAKRS